MSSLKVICFDLDDTICTLGEGERRARLILIEKLVQESEVSRDEITRAYDNEWAKIKTNYMSLVKDGLDDIDIREKLMISVLEIIDSEVNPQEYAKLYCSETMSGIHIFPDARGVMDALGEKYQLAMITNGASAWQREKIEKLDIEGYFEEIIVSGELGHHKPSPKIFNEMTGRMGVTPNEIIYIGNDYRKDIQGAKATGWRTAWVKRTDEVRDETVPDYTISELSELLKIL
ncbi:HAD family hydrolase [Candidatus Bathyarchaeota archaeon]|nr:HAD family hydrolase [Candidatus Bathyarchaeota archaeon]MBT4422748.1 HAD family hydrolase [Candidatus Bathyarchaeota archaeon]MBT7186204.1 HAD family hydrolase [Candidatus Bathyarchaeota archaeon]MBT7345704.1 HAD family hydrolase [Candidatus Bathyarchaeota archaeon]